MKIEFNQMFSVEMPEGEISQTGVREIGNLISRQRLDEGEWKALNPDVTGRYLPGLPDDWQWVWVVERGDYAGTMPKRVAKHYFKAHNLRCPSAFLQEIGNIARAHSGKKVVYQFDFNAHIDWQAGDFGDGGSCYWGEHEGACEMMREQGAFAIRFFDNDDNGFGRAWIFDAGEFFILWNGYGFTSDSTLTIARIYATYAGMAYERVGLTNYGRTTGVLYINGWRGYAIGPADVVADVESYDFEWEEIDAYSCASCGDSLSEDDRYTGADEQDYCQHCYYELFTDCYHCGEVYYRDSDSLTYIESEGADVCDHCLERYYFGCGNCDKYFPQREYDALGQCPGCEAK